MENYMRMYMIDILNEKKSLRGLDKSKIEDYINLLKDDPDSLYKNSVLEKGLAEIFLNLFNRPYCINIIKVTAQELACMVEKSLNVKLI